jgi:hypothetical protein
VGATCTPHALTDHAAVHVRHSPIEPRAPTATMATKRRVTTQLSRVRICCLCPCSPSIFLASHHLRSYNLQRLHRLFIGGVRHATCHKLCGSAHHVATGRFHQSPQEKLMMSLPGSTSHATRMAEAGHSHAQSATCSKRQEERLGSTHTGWRRNTRPRSSGGRSEHGDEPWTCGML